MPYSVPPAPRFARPLLWQWAPWALLAGIAWLVVGCQSAPVPASARATRASVEAVQLVQVRRWTRPPGPGQRVRLGQGASGRLGIAWTERMGRGALRARVEDMAGVVRWERQVSIGISEYHPLVWGGTQPLVRDGEDLVLGQDVTGSGEWEAYSAIPGAALAWAPCERAAGSREPCPASLSYRVGGTKWGHASWRREIFGLDMLELTGSATGTVAVATRENPGNSGWTLRVVSTASLRDGDVGALAGARTEMWKPARDLSLEDPMLVRGTSRPVLIGTAQQQTATPGVYRRTGRVFLAEAGAALREVLQGDASAGNSEVSAVVHGGVLWLALEVDGRTALYRWQAGAFGLAGSVEGLAPALASAEGSVWLSSSAGLWRVQQ